MALSLNALVSRRGSGGGKGKTLISPDIHRILVIKLRAVGDVLLSTVVTKNLRLAFPEAQIDFLTERPAHDIVSGNPFINAALVYDRTSKGSLRWLQRVRRRRYDLVIDLFGNPRTALLTRWSGARYRVGFAFRGRAYAYTIPVTPRGNRVHNTQFNLDALEAIGVPIVDRSLQFFFSEEDQRYVDDFLAPSFPNPSRLAGIITGGGWYTKRWGLDRFAAVADRLSERYGDHIVLVWGPGQEEDVRRLRSLMKRPALIPAQTTLRQLGALLHRLAYVVSNDSGPMHLAAAVGTPVLGLYGPTNPLLQGPYGPNHVIVRREGLDCLGCNLTVCPIGHPCMLQLDVDAVMKGVKELLEKNEGKVYPPV